MIYKPLVSRILISFLSFLTFSLTAQEVDIDAGKTLFKNQCAACHNKNMKDALIGPPLGGTQDRWADYPREDLYSWVRNSQALISKEHPLAVQFWNSSKPMVMTNFPDLTDQEIENILGYIDAVYTGKPVSPKVKKGEQTTNVEKPEQEQANSLTTQEADIEAGKTLFKNQCAACHNKNMKDAMTGPALGGTQERWVDYPREDLYAWVRNSQALISKGQARAVQLWNDNKPIVMNNFPALSDQEIENVLGYIDAVYTGKLGGPKVAQGAPATGIAVQEPKTDNTLLFVVLFVVLVFLAIVLARIVSNLNYMAQVQAGDTAAKRKTFAEVLTSKGVISFVIFALVVLGGFTTVNNAINLGRQKGYMPDQPIKYSHATHAGLNKINCQYCHDGARRSKHSIIPAANTCMNCHRAIKKGSKYGTGELTKIFASIGFNPNTDQYLSDYDNLSKEDVEKIYKKWISDEYVKDHGSLGPEGERTVEEQWKGIVKALTDPENGDNKIQGPIEWIKIHNLPDHVFFSHAQHVSVGKVQCQQCHGRIEEMEVVAQQAPLSMGWCVNCHRKTNVQFMDNPYYESFPLYHEQMVKGERDHVTVEEIGGTECQKCHY